MSNSLPLPPTHRKKNTPKAIRTFVAQRAAAGMPLDLLAQLVGVGYHTVLSWCKKEVLVQEGGISLTASQLRKRNRQSQASQAHWMDVERKRIKHDIRTKGLQILLDEQKENLAELKRLALQQADFRKWQKELKASTIAESTDKHLEMAHGIVRKVRALNPTAMNLQSIAVELGITVDDIFAAYRLTNQRFKQ